MCDVGASSAQLSFVQLQLSFMQHHHHLDIPSDAKRQLGIHTRDAVTLEFTDETAPHGKTTWNSYTGIFTFYIIIISLGRLYWFAESTAFPSFQPLKCTVQPGNAPIWLVESRGAPQDSWKTVLQINLLNRVNDLDLSLCFWIQKILFKNLNWNHIHTFVSKFTLKSLFWWNELHQIDSSDR